MIHLFISAYPEKDRRRSDELLECLNNNLKSGCFDAIWIIAEDDGKGIEYLNGVDRNRINILPCSCRPTFRTFFNAINTIDDRMKNANQNFQIFGATTDAITIQAKSSIGIQMEAEENVYIVCNSDIYFEEIPVLPKINQVFALSRYERVKNGPIRFEGRRDSQDSWIFRSKIRLPKFIDFFSLPGADNRLAWELMNVGYEVLNPSLTIKSYHLHEGAKSYDGSQKVQRPYHFISPIELNQ